LKIQNTTSQNMQKNSLKTYRNTRHYPPTEDKFEPSVDKESLFAVDSKQNSPAGYSLVKINTETGRIEWKRERYTEKFIDYRVVNNEINLLTANKDQNSVTMTKLDSQGNILWEDTLPMKAGENNIGTMNCISDRGDFIFGCDDGNLYCLHPKMEGETKETIREKIAEKSDEHPDANNKEEEKITIQDDSVVIGGVKLKRNKES